MRAPPARSLADYAHRAFVGMLGVVTVTSAGYFAMNAYSIITHVNQQASVQQPQQQAPAGEGKKE